MPRKLVKHGTNSGYRAEIGAGNDPCTRCQNAHRVFQTQYSRSAKAAGIKYRGDQVIDHLYGTSTHAKQNRPTSLSRTADNRPTAAHVLVPDQDGTDPQEAVLTDRGASWADRLRNLALGDDDNEPSNEYVSEDEYPSYLSGIGIDPDPEPDDEDYSRVSEDSADYVINAAGMAKIEDSLGTYLSIFGITIEIIDPYCGPVLAENMDNIVKHWAKVIAKYPKAADIFMDTKGGTLMAWIGALQATWPFLFAIYEHHLSKNVQTDGGTIFRRNSSPGVRPNDPMQPPMPDTFQYSAA